MAQSWLDAGGGRGQDSRCELRNPEARILGEVSHSGMSEVIALHQFRRPTARDEIPPPAGAGRATTGKPAAEPPVFFDRREFRAILNLYARMVGMGERSEEHTSELQSLMRISYAVFCLKKKKTHKHKH